MIQIDFENAFFDLDQYELTDKILGSGSFGNLLGISHALNYLHQNKIIHRDLKPGNVLMDSKLHPRVSDFGLSRCFRNEGSTELSKTAGVGTPKYMAPELLQFNKNYSPSVDVYAFGVMAYEIVTGHEPYVKKGEQLTMQLILSKVMNNNDPPDYPDDAPVKARCLINSCLSKDPLERPTFDYIYNQLASPELNFLDVSDSEKDEIRDYIDLLQQNHKEDEIKASNDPQKTVEVSESYNPSNSSANFLNPDQLSNSLQSSDISLSMTGSKYGLIFNKGCEIINQKLIDERKFYSKIIKRLIPKIEDINEKNEKGNTILHLACSTGNIVLVKKICMNENILYDLRNKNDQSILFSACFSENIDLLKYLITLPKLEVNSKDNNKMTLLHYVCQIGNLELVQYLVSLDKIDIKSKDNDGNNALHYACQSGNLQLVDYLIKLNQIDVEEKNNENTSVLHFGCQSGNVELVKYLLSLKILNIQDKNNKKKSCLHFACEKDSLSLVDYLIRLNKIDLTAKDFNGKTILQYSCESSPKIAKYLIGLGKFNLLAKDDRKNTLLHIDAKNGNFEIVKYLIDLHQINISTQNDQNETILHNACESGNLELVKYLIELKHFDLKLMSS